MDQLLLVCVIGYLTHLQHDLPKALNMSSGRGVSCFLQWQIITGVCVLLLSARLCTSLRAVPEKPSVHASEVSERASPPRTLCFELCNGFANQRIGLATGILLAHLLGRSAVLPEALAYGRQATDEWNSGQLKDLFPLSELYDTEYLLESLHQSGILAVGPEHAPPAKHYHGIKSRHAPDGDVLKWLATFSDHAHLTLDCLFLRLLPTQVKTHASVFWAVVDAIRPSQALSTLVQKGVQEVSTHSNRSSFTFLHLRIENNWLEHCQRRSRLLGGGVRTNCFNNTFGLSKHFESKGIDKANPVYIASSWKQTSSQMVKQVMMDLVSGGYTIFTSTYLYSDHEQSLLGHGVLGRERMACVDYYLALKSDKFIGNSVSTFSALLLLERQRQEAWASYYNGGNVPLSASLPLYQLPWVFTYNSWSFQYDYMLKAAVRSGLHHGTLKPYCLFAGNGSAPIVGWLKDHGVTMISASPKWADRLVAVLNASHVSNIAHSHLYANADMQIGTWQRIDVPILPILNQYEYILFTDADVYFRRPVTLDSFRLPLPETIGMASEADDIFPYNAGIMLMHLPAMRSTYAAFIDFIFSNKHGLFFPAYGPGDQGAINQFYEDSVKGAKVNQAFNAKPYHNFLSTAYIVHFHGPKPNDYLTSVENNTCAFGEMCTQGITHAFCVYALEWAEYVQDEDVGQRAQVKCSMVLHEKETVFLASDTDLPISSTYNITLGSTLIERI